MATALAYRNLGRGYVLLFGELRLIPDDKRTDHFPLTEVGQVRSIETDALLAHTVMDEGFFEELMHPHEATPHSAELELLACESSSRIGFWLWAVDLPE